MLLKIRLLVCNCLHQLAAPLNVTRKSRYRKDDRAMRPIYVVVVVVIA